MNRPDICSARAPTRRRRAPPICRGSRSPGASRRSARARRGSPWATRLRARQRRRLRALRRGARDAGPARPGGLSMMEAGAAARDLLHRVGQRVRARAAAAGRNAARAWRLVRHRHDRDHARQGLRRDRHRHRGLAGKCDACRKLGADRAIDYKTEDFVAAVKEATAGSGADVILDMVGGSLRRSATTQPPPRAGASCRSPSWTGPKPRWISRS